MLIIIDPDDKVRSVRLPSYDANLPLRALTLSYERNVTPVERSQTALDSVR